MQIPDFPFEDQDGSSFPHHSAIRRYLLDYAAHFNLYPYIKVSHIGPKVTQSRDNFSRLSFALSFLSPAKKKNKILKSYYGSTRKLGRFRSELIPFSVLVRYYIR